jgi:hypothetical protein
MDDKLLKRFFSSGKNHNSNNSLTPNYSTFDMTPQYNANKYYSNNNLSSDYTSNNTGMYSNHVLNTVTPPEYRYSPQNIPNPKYLPEQVKYNEFNSFNRRDHEINNRQQVYRLLI